MFCVTDFISIETAITLPPSTELETLHFTSPIAGNFFTLFSRIPLVPVYPFAFGCNVFLWFRQTETIFFVGFNMVIVLLLRFSYANALPVMFGSFLNTLFRGSH